MRKTWGVINDTLQRNRRSKPQSEFIFGNLIIRDTYEIANHFNDYFLTLLVHCHNKFSRFILLTTTYMAMLHHVLNFILLTKIILAA